jgi:hypothetical protein
MIRRDLADNEGMARLSDGAARLFFYLYPHLDSYGKFAGGVGTIQETVVPRLGWKPKKIRGYLVEINRHTSMKIWIQNGRVYVHDVCFFDEQDIREDRRGRDSLPSYPGADRMKTGTSPFLVPEYVPDLLPHEVEVEVEGEEDVDGERAAASGPLGGQSAPRNDNGNGSDSLTSRPIFEGFRLPTPGNGKAKPSGRKPAAPGNPVTHAIIRMECGKWNTDQAIQHLVENGYTDAKARAELGVTAK